MVHFFLYVQIFCRSTVVLIFTFSCLSKVRHIDTFQRTITNFAIVSPALSRLAAPLFLCAEALVVVLLLLAGPSLLAGYLLAAMLLLLFCLAMLSVLIRHISTTCSCFGPSARPISPVSIVRNIGFIACAIGGCLTLIVSNHAGNLDFTIWMFSGLCALIFAAVWTQLDEIVQLFR